ncbi:osteocalcin [Hemicordylus capensis]|uniref:osteocalcin n=1 Tax=Hemicordylus capensis TaxID=884348 RepID=UPI002303754E|nr:osteocalcin [Hemicordylus capensis]
MNTLTLVSLLAVATLCLCHGGDSSSNSANDSPSSEAFVSKRESAEVVKRHKRHYNRVYDDDDDAAAFAAAVAAAPATVTRDPYEPQREVCELNPACDELADHIGFHEAYRRFYGPL